MKPLPKLSPRGDAPLGADENPFTLPSARLPPAAAPAPAPAAAPKAPEPAKPAEPPAKADAPVKEGLGARLMRSLGRSAPPPSKPPEIIPDPVPVEPEEKKTFSLPPARVVTPVEEAPEPAPVPEPVAEAPAPAAPAVGELPPVVPAEDGAVDLDAAPPEPAPEPPAKPAAKAAVPAPAPAPAPVPDFDALSDPLADPLATPAPAASPAPSPVPAKPFAPPAPAVPAPAPAAAPTAAAPTPPAAEPQGSRGSPVYIAAIAGAALGTVSVLAVYLLLRSDGGQSSRAPRESPFAKGTAAPMAQGSPSAPVAPVGAPAVPVAAAPAPVAAAPAPTVTPAPPISSPAPTLPAPAPSPVPASPAPDAARPAASFASAPRVTVKGQAPIVAPKPAAPVAAEEPEEDSDMPSTPAEKPVRKAAAAAPAARRPKGPSWTFEGVVFDLLTARGVFAAKLSFLDADGNEVGSTETGPGGRYKAVLPQSGAGYTLKISHQDYTSRYIDEGDQTSSLREATPEERKILMQAASRNLPWVGNLKKPVRRDLALVPRTPEEP